MSIYETLANVQTTLNAPKNRWNDFGKYHYRNAEDILDALKPILKPLGASVVLSDDIEFINGRFYVRATATLYCGGESVSCSAMAREDESKKGMDGAQITGACSSYARKYALNGLFAIDDSKDSDYDGNGEDAATPARTPAQAKKGAPVNNNAPASKAAHEALKTPVQAMPQESTQPGWTADTPIAEASGWSLNQLYEHGGADLVNQLYAATKDAALKVYIKRFAAAHKDAAN